MKYSKITISGKICTGKSTLFRKLKKELKWPSFSTGQYFRNLAKNKHLSLVNAEEQNEKITKEVDYRVRDLLKLDKHLIVEGWMSGIMADKLPYVLRILLISDDAVRFRRFVKREKISLAEAKSIVEERQQNWIKRLKKIYNRNDFFDPKNYNCIIETTYISPMKVLRTVLDRLGYKP